MSQDQMIAVFNDIKVRDQIKNKIAKDVGIFLLRIGYNENVEDILEKTFSSY